MNLSESIKNAKKIVIKVGTSTLTYPNGKLNLRRIETLSRVLANLKNQGRDVILVSSGAIGVGVSKLGMRERPHDTIGKQAAAAVGQCELMNIYGRLFAEYGYTVGQVLVTKDIVDHAQREENAKNSLLRMMELGIIPIVNENDTVAVEEIEFGDNDTLSAMVAVLIKADVLVLMSDIDGLYDSDPHINEDAQLIRIVHGIDDKIRSMAGDTNGDLGTGGMTTKIHAAEIATSGGIHMIVTNGEKPDILYDIFDGKIEGTIFEGMKK